MRRNAASVRHSIPVRVFLDFLSRQYIRHLVLERLVSRCPLDHLPKVAARVETEAPQNNPVLKTLSTPIGRASIILELVQSPQPQLQVTRYAFARIVVLHVGPNVAGY
jgi:hypothetical protein